jgi:DNA-binding transcriptional MerR regulator
MGQRRGRRHEPKPEELPFGAADVVEFLGVNPATFQQWMNRGIVPFETVTRGGRTYRRFTYEQANRISIIGALHEQGLEPSVCKGMADRLAPVIAASDALTEKHYTGDEPALVPGIDNFEQSFNQSVEAGATEEQLGALLRDHLARLEEPAPSAIFSPVVVMGKAMTICDHAESLEYAILSAESTVCFLVDLYQIQRRLDLRGRPEVSWK